MIQEANLNAILRANLHDPHAHLGMHPATQGGTQGLVVRAFLDGVAELQVVDYSADTENRYPMDRMHADGLFQVFIPNRKKLFPYRLRAVYFSGEIRQFYDPYSFLPTISEHDLYLFNEGTHHRIYEKLGSHLRTINGVQGMSFAVWAPSAQRVSVVGEFNHWDGRYHMMRSLGSSGVWEIFIPGLPTGQHYKYEIKTREGAILLKSDPYAIHFESPPHNASITWDIADYEWSDDAWMEKRAKSRAKDAPMSIYEVHLGSWKRVVEDGNRPMTYRELAVDLVNYVKKLGFTHVEFMPVAEHPLSASWGYQVTGFFAPTHRFGTPQDFMCLIDCLHQNDIGVIVDWVPAHFPKDAFALAEFDGTHLYEHADPREGYHEDWGTLIFNYGRHEVRSFLIASALSWMERFHIDGFRVDAVASMLYRDYSRKEGEWVPNEYGGKENIEAIEFLRQVNDLAHQYYPGTLMIAEESTAFSGVTSSTKDYGLGFDFKWNMGWMHDTIKYLNNDPVHRSHHHNSLTFAMLYQYSEHFVSTFSHDEVVHGKGSMIRKMGSWNQNDQAATLRALYAYMWTWPGKKTLFMGSEFGQTSEWNYDQSLDWHLLEYTMHSGIQKLVADLNALYKSHPQHAKLDNDQAGFQWICADDHSNSVLSYLRVGPKGKDPMLCVINFTPVQRNNYRLGIPSGGTWKEVLNTDASCYGGNNIGNNGEVVSQPDPSHGRDHSLSLTLPPLGAIILQPTK